jgi:hypothetical protein
MPSAALTIREAAAAAYSGFRDFSEANSAAGDVAYAADRARTAIAADPDAVEELADTIVVLSAHIHAATHRLLVLIADFDGIRGWELAGHSTCAHWLAARTGIDLGAATTAQLERMIRAWKRCSRRDEGERERDRIASRSFSMFPDDDGMYVVRGRLTPEVGALLMRAVDAAADALFRSAPADDGTVSDPASNDDASAAAQRRADAVALLAERALAAGFGAGRSTARAERYQVVVHVDDATLSDTAETGRSELEDGTRVSAETSRRLSCDAGVVRVTRDGTGKVLDVGRRTRTIPPALRRALEVRDRGCRFPACGSRFTDAHHVRHWADGGATSLANCLLLCAHHHRLVHEGGWRVAWWGDAAVFRDPRGHEHHDGGWKPPAIGAEPVRALVTSNEARGIAPDAALLGARWRRETDIPGDVYLRACEAL